MTLHIHPYIFSGKQKIVVINNSKLLTYKFLQNMPVVVFHLFHVFLRIIFFFNLLQLFERPNKDFGIKF